MGFACSAWAPSRRARLIQRLTTAASKPRVRATEAMLCTGLDTLEGAQTKLFEGGMIERAAVARALSVLAFGLHGCSMGSH